MKTMKLKTIVKMKKVSQRETDEEQLLQIHKLFLYFFYPLLFSLFSLFYKTITLSRKSIKNLER
ncbi:223L [Invertebrate iridescent virus Kaz2018]|uniref:223L n=1 Tax=Invertebrate iridescent virus 6 TaxID=176652 RepID=Q91FU8_IIV6|nr:223L [Invertebrate iridescent virus 6]AAK82085.1 223L [Invertebrate iridescent virus 6]QNH08633.1 223L [Invertebrate iridescent virus Kaz2018]